MTNDWKTAGSRSLIRKAIDEKIMMNHFYGSSPTLTVDRLKTRLDICNELQESTSIPVNDIFKAISILRKTTVIDDTPEFKCAVKTVAENDISEADLDILELVVENNLDSISKEGRTAIRLDEYIEFSGKSDFVVNDSEAESICSALKTQREQKKERTKKHTADKLQFMAESVDVSIDSNDLYQSGTYGTSLTDEGKKMFEEKSFSFNAE